MANDWRNIIKRFMTPELRTRSDLLKKMQDSEPIIYDEILRIHTMGIPGIVAGGFASYLLGLTKTYSDVDFFTHSFEGIMKLATSCNYYCVFRNYYQTNRTTERTTENFLSPEEFREHLKKNGLVINHKYIKLQVIYIYSEEFSGLAYYTELIRCFDVPACQKGIFVVLPGRERFGVDTTTTYYIDQYHSFIGNYKLFAERLETRKAKYARRFVCSGEVETLRSLCQTVIRKMDPDYKMIRLEL